MNLIVMHGYPKYTHTHIKKRTIITIGNEPTIGARALNSTTRHKNGPNEWLSFPNRHHWRVVISVCFIFIPNEMAQ